MDGDEAVDLPKSTVVKRAKKNHHGIIINNDVQDALVTSSTEFIKLITSEASEVAKGADRTTITPAFIIEACKRLGFEHYTEQLQAVANSASDDAKEKRDKKRSSQSAISPEERARLQELMFAEAAAELNAGMEKK